MQAGTVGAVVAVAHNVQIKVRRGQQEVMAAVVMGAGVRPAEGVERMSCSTSYDTFASRLSDASEKWSIYCSDAGRLAAQYAFGVAREGFVVRGGRSDFHFQVSLTAMLRNHIARSVAVGRDGTRSVDTYMTETPPNTHTSTLISPPRPCLSRTWWLRIGITRAVPSMMMGGRPFHWPSLCGLHMACTPILYSRLGLRSVGLKPLAV